MSETLTYQARGLYLGPSDLQTPDGAMLTADDVVISREGVVETRRGLEVVGTKALSRVFPFKGAMVGHGGATLSRSINSGVTWTDYSTALAPPSDSAVRAVEAAANLYLTSSVGVYRLDSLTATPEAAGVPEGLDVELALSGAGTALPTANQVAYRVAFGKRDANKRLLLGSPSGRAVISNTAGSTQNVTVSATIPRGLDSTHFYQAYRSAAATAADDELGLVYEAAVPVSKTATQLARVTNVVTASVVGHGLVAGQTIRVSPGGAVAGHLVAIGDAGAISRSTDNGATWSTAGITGFPSSSSWTSVTSSGALYVAVGGNACATSPDGLTWTARTIPSGNYTAVTWTGTRYVAVGTSGVGAYSTDGTTWTGVTVVSSTYDWSHLAWNGSVLMAVGTDGAYGQSTISTDHGSTWGAASATVPGPAFANGVAWNGSRWVVVGSASGNFSATWSANGTFWTLATVPSVAANVGGLAWSGTAFVAPGGSGRLLNGSADGTTWTEVTLTGTWSDVTWDGTSFVAIGTNTAATAAAAGTSWTIRTIATGTYRGVGAGGGASFVSGEKTVTGAPTADTFTYAETGSDGTLVQSQTVEPLSLTFTDSVPDGFRGASLYTNPNQEGILNANARPLIAKDAAVYQGSLFQANVTTPAYGTAYFLGGLSDGDTVTINAVVYTASTAESIPTKTFKRFTAGTAAENIRDTAASLIRVVNRSLSTGVSAQYVSGEDDPPGAILFTSSDSVTSLAVTFSRTTSWSPATGLAVTPRAYVNGLVWTKTDQPDHVPKSLWLVPQRVGSDDKAILRVLPTRSSLFILKEDGLWRLTGSAGVWDITPFDPTVRVVSPESAVVLDNTIFALSEAGAIRISDTGTALMSRQPGVCDIEPALQDLLSPTVRDATTTYAFGVAYESDHKYLLWVPTEYTDTKATQAYVYDLFTRTWTRWTPDASHGFVNPADDRLYLVDGTSVWQERKTIDTTDLADRSYAVTISSGGGTATVTLASAADVIVGDVISGGGYSAIVTAKATNTLTLNTLGPPNGAATSYRAIATEVTWAPKFGRNPAAWTELQSVRLIWDDVAFDSCYVGFASDITDVQVVTVRGADYGGLWTPMLTAHPGMQIEVWPPRDVSIGSRFLITFAHRQAWSRNSIAALAVSFRSTTWRVGR